MNKKSLWKLILILAIPCIIGFMPAQRHRAAFFRGFSS
ncbi:hypothetical protein ACUOA8_29760, partial [Escherichia sp. SS-MK2]